MVGASFTVGAGLGAHFTLHLGAKFTLRCLVLGANFTQVLTSKHNRVTATVKDYVLKNINLLQG